MSEFRIYCSDELVYADATDENFTDLFRSNRPLGYEVISVNPVIFPRNKVQRHRVVVYYGCNNPRSYEQIPKVREDMTKIKPINADVGDISVIPGGYSVEYGNYCKCYVNA